MSKILKIAETIANPAWQIEADLVWSKNQDLLKYSMDFL
jgi:hypothetical protein